MLFSLIAILKFNDLFLAESSKLGYPIPGIEVISLLQGQLRPEMIGALKKIKGQLIQACLTNNISSPNEELSDENVSIAGKNDEIMSLFDFVIASSELNVRKPDPDFYQLALEEAKVKPNEVVFLDDLGINLKPARALGMHTIKVIDANNKWIYTQNKILSL